MTGHIYNIQRFSIHDGPGIRTTVFLKGCPLSCKWCHNPESQTNKSVLMYGSSKCIGCYDCISNCPNAALSKEEDISGTPTGLIHIERNRCISCGTCAKVCPAGAIDLLGRPMTVEEIIIEIRKDDEFYKSSGGGITVSGGEPLHQSNFTLELVKALKHEKYHVTLDTSGYSEFSTLKNLITYVDLFLFDVKHIDQKKHLKYTGVNNALILRNLKKLSRHGCRVWARIPLIPSFNAEETDMHEIAYSLSDLRVEKVCVLPYHGIASGKYTRLDQTYELIGMKSPSQDEIDRAESILKNYGLNVQIGG